MPEIRRKTLLTATLALGVLAVFLAPATSRAAAETPPSPAATPLTPAQISGAATLDTLTVPTPGELFVALSKQAKINWPAQFRGPIGASYSDRAQAALNLGGLIADGYVAIEAMDGRQVKNLGRDILDLAKTLGISKEILARGNSITQFADDNDWNALKEELESTQNEAKQAMESLHDEDLVTLVTLGGWIRGTQVVSDVVLKGFSEQNAAILRQPQIVGYLRDKLTKLSPKLRDGAMIKAIDAGLEKIEKLVSFPLGDTISKDNVQKLNNQAGELIKLIASKKSDS